MDVYLLMERPFHLRIAIYSARRNRGAMQARKFFVQAIEVVNIGISGPRVRHTRSHILFHRQRVQCFSTSRCLARVEPSLSPQQQRNFDDEIVPLVAGGDIKGQSRLGEVREDGSNRDRRLEVDEEWEPEIEIPAPAKETEMVSGDPVIVEESSAAGVESGILEVEADSTMQNSGAVALEQPVGGRAATRLARKERRIREGTYPPIVKALSSAGRDGEGMKEEHDDVTHSAFEKIKAMDGPPFPIKQPKKLRKTPPSEINETDRSAKVQNAGKPAADANSKPADTTTQVKTSQKEPWQIRKAALAAKFGSTGWQPRKRLSPDTLEGIRALHKSDPMSYSTAILAEHFKITPDAIRRILKSKWRPNEDEVEDRRQRWEKRGLKKWEDMADKGMKPPVKWRAMGVKSPAARARGGRKVREDEYVKWDDR